MKLFEIGFFTFRLVDVFDILLVTAILYALYRIIKGSIAVSILLGFFFFFILWFVVRALNMRLMTVLLNQFMSVSALALLIVFQQEIRRFLLMIGKSQVVSSRREKSWKEYLPWHWNTVQNDETNFIELADACKA